MFNLFTLKSIYNKVSYFNKFQTTKQKINSVQINSKVLSNGMITRPSYFELSWSLNLGCITHSTKTTWTHIHPVIGRMQLIPLRETRSTQLSSLLTANQANVSAWLNCLIRMDAASILKLLGFNIHDTLRRENQSVAVVRCPTHADGFSVVLKKDTEPHVQTLTPPWSFFSTNFHEALKGNLSSNTYN